jgi:hypothetical protein
MPIKRELPQLSRERLDQSAFRTHRGIRSGFHFILDVLSVDSLHQNCLDVSVLLF